MGTTAFLSHALLQMKTSAIMHPEFDSNIGLAVDLQDLREAGLPICLSEIICVLVPSRAPSSNKGTDLRLA